jgi:Tol biopolymer transport system component
MTVRPETPRSQAPGPRGAAVPGCGCKRRPGAPPKEWRRDAATTRRRGRLRHGGILLDGIKRASQDSLFYMRTWFIRLVGLLAAVAVHAQPAPLADAAPLRERLKPLPFKIAYESYVKGNWEIFVMNPDGSHPVNLTKTPDLNEHYPQISPDGARMCFVADKGEGRDAIRSLYVMEVDGRHRKKIADYAREPFWSPDGKVIGFLDQEYPKFNVIDYYTKGMNFYDVATGTITPHPNYTNLHHLYNPNFSANGKWIVATVHAGMGFDHTILLIEAHGNKIIDLKIPGCRPRFSPDGKQIAWGASDNEIAAGSIDTEADEPKIIHWEVRIKDAKNKIYHARWSPDGQFLSFSRGPDGEGDPNKMGTFQAACEIMGVYAPGWNIGVVPAEQAKLVDLNVGTPADFTMLTTNGLSNKESAWFWPRRK